MYFDIKSYLKSIHNYTVKHSLKYIEKVELVGNCSVMHTARAYNTRTT